MCRFDTQTAMKQNRRHFLKSASVASLAMPELLSSVQAMPMHNGAPDEAYWKLVRRQFPLTQKKIYLNNGTMGPSPFPVIETMHKSMADMDEHGSYGGWEDAVKKIAAFTGADESEIALTSNVTQGVNIACWGFPLKKGDEVIISTHEHVGGCLAWLNRAKLHGIVIKTFSPGATADETLANIQKQYTSKTRMLAIPHIPCTQGQVMPVKEFTAWGKSKGLFVFIDGAHGPGMMPLNLHEIGCDAYASCCHKWMLGPKGTGFLYVKKEMLSTVQSYFIGAGGDDNTWNMSKPNPQFGQYSNSAHRYFYGTQNTGLFKGVIAAIDFMEQIGMPTVFARVQELSAYTQASLQNTLGEKLELLTPNEGRSRGAVTGFRIKGEDYKKVYEAVMKENIVIRQVPENDINCLRVSTHIYNNKQEIDALMDVLKKFA